MTFEEYHELLLQRLDKVYAQLREIHADNDWLNDNTEFREVEDRFNKVQEDIWKFKGILENANKPR